MRKVPSKWETGLTEIADDCYAFIQSGGVNVSNAGFILGRESNLVIDTLYVKPMVEAFLREIQKNLKKTDWPNCLHPSPCRSHSGQRLVSPKYTSYCT